MIEHDEYRNEQYLEAPLDPAWLPYSDEIVRLAIQLRRLDLIEGESPGRLRPNEPSEVWAIEADHPDGGPWLYTRDGVDTIMASRMRPDGQREHAVLDEHGMPTEWRVVLGPQFN